MPKKTTKKKPKKDDISATAVHFATAMLHSGSYVDWEYDDIGAFALRLSDYLRNPPIIAES